jgi:MFS family permease
MLTSIKGIMISYWVDLGFYYTAGGVSWRFPIAIQIVFAMIMIIAMVRLAISNRTPLTRFQYAFRLPESPRWLASKGKHAEALAVLAALDNKPVDDKHVLQTWHGICDAVAAEQGGFSLRMLMQNGKTQHLRRTLLGILAQCFQQISGIKWVRVKVVIGHQH